MSVRRAAERAPLAGAVAGHTRRDCLATVTLSVLAGAAGCAPTSLPPAVLALPERSLPYAPLILAVKQGLGGASAPALAMIQRAESTAVAAAVAGGEADAGALPLPALLDAAEQGAPLVVIGAITRRVSAHLLVPAAQSGRLTAKSLLDGAWRGLRLGTQTGDVERFVRALWLASGRATRVTTPPYIPTDPLAGEPRYSDFQTDEALVAALRDGRVDGVCGSAIAAAQSTVLGESHVVASFSTGEVAPDIAAAHAVVLVAHRDAAAAPARRQTLAQIVAACAHAANELAGTSGVATLKRALPDRDLLHLSLALAADSPEPHRSVYALDGQFQAGTLETLAELRARAGRRSQVDVRSLHVTLA